MFNPETLHTSVSVQGKLTVALADSKLHEFHIKYKKKYVFYDSENKKRNSPWDPEKEIKFLSFWIRKNATSKKINIKGDIRIADLKRVLKNNNIELDHYNNTIEVYILKEKKILGLIPKGSEKTNKKTYYLSGNKNYLQKTILNNLRKDYNLTVSNGYDDTFFYDDTAFIDAEIMFYKSLIYRLSRT